LLTGIWASRAWIARLALRAIDVVATQGPGDRARAHDALLMETGLARRALVGYRVVAETVVVAVERHVTVDLDVVDRHDDLLSAVHGHRGTLGVAGPEQVVGGGP